LKDGAREPTNRRWIGPALVAVLLAIVYWPALQGGWVWDDHAALENTAALFHPWNYFTKDVYSALTGHPGTIYRPLCYLSYVPDQWLSPGPFAAKVGNLVLHFAAAMLVKALAEALGASRGAALFGAVLFAFHPGASEPVAYAVCRHVTLPTVCVLGAWLALLQRRDALAGALVAVTPFAGEYFLFAFATLVVWMVATRRFAPRALVVSLGGLAAYLAVREILHLSFWSDATGTDLHLAGALGGFAVRGLDLLLVPSSPDIVYPFTANAFAGVVVVVAFVALLALLPDRPVVAALVAPLWLMLPCALISAQISLVGDRYYYVGFAGIGIAVALLFDGLSRTVSWPLWVLAPACAYATWLRGFDWKDDVTLFESSLTRGEHSRAAFFLAWRYHERGDCEHAIPLYERAIAVDGRAGPNLQACLVDMGRYEEAAALGPKLTSQPRVRVTAYLNTARALVQLGRLDEAEEWARGGTRVAENDPRAWIMLGNILGMQGDVAKARPAFEMANRLAPDDPDAKAGLMLVARADEARDSAESKTGLPEPAPAVRR